jgi:hypothetical protein
MRDPKTAREKNAEATKRITRARVQEFVAATEMRLLGHGTPSDHRADVIVIDRLEMDRFIRDLREVLK